MKKESPFVVEAKNISKIYSNAVVLHDVSLSLLEGEVFGFLGPNGAGKSTLMRIIMGVETPNSGTLLFFGKNIDWQVRQKIGIVPQDNYLYKQFSVSENLYFFGLLNNVTGGKLKKRVDFLLEWLSLAKFKNTKAEYLSGGYRKLLNIGCSLVHDPQIIFLDEPTVALDPLIRSHIWEKIIEMKEQKKTVCLTTHYLEEAQILCDRIAILFGGRIMVEGTPESLIEQYGGKEIITLKIEQPNQEALSRLRDGFPEYFIQIKEDTVTFIVSKRESFEAMGKVSDFLAKNNCKVISSTIKQPGIDEVFLKVTEGDKK